jgi:repressor LexA
MKTQFTPKELATVKVVRNEIMRTGKVPSIRQVMSAMEYRSPQSVSRIFDELIKKGVLSRTVEGKYLFNEGVATSNTNPGTVDVPLIGTASCGTPVFAEENIEGYFPISERIAPPSQKHFLLRAEGDSMNKKNIYDGDLVLVQKKNTAHNGDLVVALIDDEATIKEFQRHGDMVALRPHSTNLMHKPIILSEEFQIQGVVVKAIPASFFNP